MGPRTRNRFHAPIGSAITLIVISSLLIMAIGIPPDGFAAETDKNACGNI